MSRMRAAAGGRVFLDGRTRGGAADDSATAVDDALEAVTPHDRPEIDLDLVRGRGPASRPGGDEPEGDETTAVPVPAQGGAPTAAPAARGTDLLPGAPANDLVDGVGTGVGGHRSPHPPAALPADLADPLPGQLPHQLADDLLDDLGEDLDDSDDPGGGDDTSSVVEAGAILLLSSRADEHDPLWKDRALCAETDPEAFFPEKGGSPREAKRVCSSCEVRAECLDFALSNDERFGIWGGLSERERRRLKKRVG